MRLLTAWFVIMALGAAIAAAFWLTTTTLWVVVLAVFCGLIGLALAALIIDADADFWWRWR